MNSLETLTNVRSTIAGLGRVLRRRRLATAVLGATLLTVSLIPHSTSAAIFLCRTDPVVLLSDGTVIRLQTTISANPADVQRVSYTVHAPAGTTLSRLVYTGGSLGAQETVKVLADDAPNTFDTTTVATTRTSDAAVNAQTSVAGVGSGSVSGQSGDSLTVHIEDAHVNGANAASAAQGQS